MGQVAKSMNKTPRHVRLWAAVAAATLGLSLAAWTYTASAQPAGSSPPAAPPPAGAPAGGPAAGQPAPPTAPAPANPSEIAEAQQALAERFIGDALNELQEHIPNEALLRKAAALIEEAVRLAPDEPRYSRMLAEAWGELGETDRAIDALTTYRATLRRTQAPEDQVAQARLIELYLQSPRMQTVDKRVAYLRNVTAKESLSPEVRSYAASAAVPLLLQRSAGEAADMVRLAVKLNPLNPAARKWEWELIAATGTPAEQIQSVLAMLRCDPAQLSLLVEAGRQLARAGLSVDSLDWFKRARILSLRTATPLGEGVAIDYASQLFRAGVYESAERIVSDTLAQQPENVDAIFMALALHQSAGGQISYDRELSAAKRVLADRAGQAARRLTSSAAAGGGSRGRRGARRRPISWPPRSGGSSRAAPAGPARQLRLGRRGPGVV